MAATQKTQIKLTFAYQYNDGERTYTITKKNDDDDYYSSILKQRVNAVNANMPNYFAESFVSDSQTPLQKISGAQYIETEEEVIYGHQ